MGPKLSSHECLLNIVPTAPIQRSFGGFDRSNVNVGAMCVVPCTRQTAASITTSRQDIIVRAFIWVGVQIECADPTNQHPRLKDASSPCLPTFKMCFYLKETCLPQIGCGAKVPIVMIMDAWWYNSTQLKCVREFLAFAGRAYVLVDLRSGDYHRDSTRYRRT